MPKLPTHAHLLRELSAHRISTNDAQVAITWMTRELATAEAKAATAHAAGRPQAAKRAGQTAATYRREIAARRAYLKLTVPQRRALCGGKFYEGHW